MITTTLPDGANRARKQRLMQILSWPGLLLVLTACTSSKLIVGPLYNKLDDRIHSEIIKLADFNAEQTAALEQSIGTFHVWHRQSELPRYATLLQEIAGSLIDPEKNPESNVTRWMATAEAFSRSARECYPLNFLSGTIRTLTDEQIDTIEKRITSERREKRERHATRTDEERVDFRMKNIEKWAGRINLELTQAQHHAVRDKLARQISLRKQFHALSDTWNQELFIMARQQEAADYENRLRTHLAKRWTLLESAYPAEWLANRQLWQDTLQEFIQSMSTEQRRNVSQWVAKMGGTLQQISQDTPSFTPGTDTGVGCLVENRS